MIPWEEVIRWGECLGESREEGISDRREISLKVARGMLRAGDGDPLVTRAGGRERHEPLIMGGNS